jgi:hypothetical protein
VTEPAAAGAWFAPIPVCPAHGQMRPDHAGAARWTCRGYDGEGCDTPPVQWTDADWQPLGRIGELLGLGDDDGEVRVAHAGVMLANGTADPFVAKWCAALADRRVPPYLLPPGDDS